MWKWNRGDCKNTQAETNALQIATHQSSERGIWVAKCEDRKVNLLLKATLFGLSRTKRREREEW